MRFSWIAGVVGALALIGLAGCENKDRGKTTENQPGTPTREGSTNTRPSETTPTSTENAPTTRLLTMIRVMSDGEIEEGKLAADHAASADVKAFGKKLVDDHTQLNQRLDQIATSKKLDLQAGRSDVVARAIDTDNRQGLDRLRGLSGQQFDAELMASQSAMHDLFSAIADQGGQASQDADLTQVFRQAADMGRDHKARALAIIPRECGGQGAAAGAVAGAEAGADAGAHGATGQRNEPAGGATGRPRAGTGTTPQGTTTKPR